VEDCAQVRVLRANRNTMNETAARIEKRINTPREKC